ncbi:MAG: PepSY domain-containing protein [Alphaproteobacteria bacterium]|nr:PepSY domain-containing protein [Alphaproteobacteria bacterium]
MTQTRHITKAVFIILALIFATNAKAEGRVNFSFSINVGGHNQSHGNGFDQIFNQVFQQGHGHGGGHYQIGANGMQFWVQGNHDHHKQVNKHKKKYKQYAQLNNKKRLVQHLRKLGYRHVKRIQRSGRYYTARAISPKGHTVWVKVDRRNGQITGKRVLAWNQRR